MTDYIIPRLFFETAKKHASKSSLGKKPEKGRPYAYISYAELEKRVRYMAAAMLDMGVEARDRVAIMSENAPEWVISDLGIMSSGALNVPVYPTLTHEQLEYILNNCEAKGIVVSNNTHYQKVMRIWEQVPTLKFIIYVDPVVEDANCSIETLSFAALLEKGEASLSEHEATIQERIDGTQPDDLCSIIYTSGTTGNPKGVMLSHKNFMSNALESSKILVDPGQPILELSFLPLSHVLERVVYYALVVVNGGTIAYVESMDTISENMLEVKPNILASVPRIYEKIYNKVIEQVHSGSALKQSIFKWALKTGKEYFYADQKGSVGFLLQKKKNLADKLVFQKIKAKTGGNLEVLLSGGAPLMKEIAEFFACIGMPILEGYGLTESSPVICVSRRGKVKFGTVGPPIPGVEVKIAEDGEILAKGPNIMRGYYQNDEATAETITDGWLHTGDIGELDEDGFLRITDRKKEILVMSNGKNVAPAPIEGLLKTSPYIEQVVLIGDNRKYISALIVPSFEALKKEAERLGIHNLSNEDACANDKLKAFMREEIDRVSEGSLARYEQLKQFALLPHEFTIENNEITPKLSMKRKVINERYSAQIEGMYALAAQSK